MNADLISVLSAFIRVSIKAESRIALFEDSSALEIADRIRQRGFVMMLGDHETVVAE